MDQGLLLFAHGARDSEWAEPFERLLALVRQRSPQVQVRLAYLELMRPDVWEATAELVTLGIKSIQIAPIFFGQGGHLRRDLPALAGALRERYPGIAIHLGVPVGEDSKVLEAVADFCVRQLR